MININTAPVDLDLIIQRGMTKAYELQLYKNGVAENITGWVITLIVKEKMSDPDSSAIINELASLSDAINGKALIRLEEANTDFPPKSYYYNIKFVDAQSPANMGIIIRGRLTIEKIV